MRSTPGGMVSIVGIASVMAVVVFAAYRCRATAVGGNASRGFAGRETSHLLTMAIFVSVGVCAWTAMVYPFSSYGDKWAIYPVVLAAPAVVLLHALAIARGPHRPKRVIEALIHIPIFVVL